MNMSNDPGKKDQEMSMGGMAALLVGIALTVAAVLMLSEHGDDLSLYIVRHYLVPH